MSRFEISKESEPIFPAKTLAYLLIYSSEFQAASVLTRESFSNVWVDRHPEDVFAAPQVTDDSNIPGNWSLRIVGISPNPFNPSVSIAFEIQNPGKVSVGVISFDDRKVATLVDQVMDKAFLMGVQRYLESSQGKF